MKKSIIYLLIVFLAILASSPFVLSEFLGVSSQLLVAPLILVVASILLVKGKYVKFEKSILNLVYIQCLLIVILFLYHKLFTGNLTNYHLIAINLIGVYIFYTLIISLIGKKEFIKFYLGLFNVLCIISVLAFFLVAFNLLEPISEFKNPDGRMNYNFGLTFSNSFNPRTNFVRVGSFFDEPGTFAYIIMLNLLLNKLSVNNKKTELIHIICGLVTFSLAHFVTVILYVTFFYGRKVLSKGLKYMIPAAIVIFGITFNNPTLSYMLEKSTIDRLQYDEEQGIKGSNRLVLTLVAYNAFKEKPFLGHGNARNDPKSKYFNVYMGANIFQPLAHHGVIGFLILFLHFIYFTYVSFVRYLKSHQFYLIVPWIIVFANFFQRPTVFGGILIYMIFLMFISLLNEK